MLMNPEWFLRNIVNRKTMEELLVRITKHYEDYFLEVVYRTHHNSFKAAFTGIFLHRLRELCGEGVLTKEEVLEQYLSWRVVLGEVSTCCEQYW